MTKGHYSNQEKYEGNCYMCTGIDDRCNNNFTKYEAARKADKPEDLICSWKPKAMTELYKFAVHEDLNKVPLTYRSMVKEFTK